MQIMKCDKNIMLLYAVTDRAWTGTISLYEQVETALKNGATCIQLREKELDEEIFLAEAKEMASLCKSYGVPLIINDNVEIAVACNAEGIHVGQEDMEALDVRKRVGENMILGVSVHTVEEAKIAVSHGADYLGLGAVFSTSTKTDVDIMSRKTLKEICNAVDIPTIAIGGISKSNVMELAGSGVNGIAVVSAIFGAENPGAATAELLSLSKEMVAK